MCIRDRDALTGWNTLGIGLAMEGKKVLLVDADPQGSLTISMGWQQPDEDVYKRQGFARRTVCFSASNINSFASLLKRFVVSFFIDVAF